MLHEILKDGFVVETIKSLYADDLAQRKYASLLVKLTSLPSDIRKRLDIPSLEELPMNKSTDEQPNDDSYYPLFE
jgi:hypothetical protein